MKNFILRNFENGHQLVIGLSYLIALIVGFVSLIWVDVSKSVDILTETFFWSIVISEAFIPNYFKKIKEECSE